MARLSNLRNSIIEDIEDFIKKGEEFLTVEFSSFSQPLELEEQIRFSTWFQTVNGLIYSMLGPKHVQYELQIFEEDIVLYKHKNYYRYFYTLQKNNLIKLKSIKNIIEKDYFYRIERELIEAFSEDLFTFPKKIFKQKRYLATNILG